MSKQHIARPKTESTPPQQLSKQVKQTVSEPGQPLDSATQSRLEGSFDVDLSEVKVHHNAHANQSAAALNARAYTVGKHVAFGQGEYHPTTQQGQALLAHELTHVAQQSDSSNANPASFRLQPAKSAAEAEASQNAQQVPVGSAANVQQRLGPGTVARAVNDPDRFDTVHQNLFVDAPGTGSQARQPWGANP